MRFAPTATFAASLAAATYVAFAPRQRQKARHANRKLAPDAA
jgi:hypothetical protein